MKRGGGLSFWLLLAASAPLSIVQAQQAEITLPPPSGAPQRITAENDPLVSMLTRTNETAGFQAVISQAVNNNPAVRQALAARQETAQDRVEARAGLLPQISVDLSSERSLARNFGTGSQNVIERSRPKSRVDALLSGEQLLYDFGATSNRIGAASARIKASEAQAQDIATTAALNAIAAHYDVLTNQYLIALGRSYLERSLNILEDSRLRFQQGYGSAGDVIRVESHYASAEGLMSDLERQLDAAKARYQEAFDGMPTGRLARPGRPWMLPPDHDSALAASQKNPIVAAAEAQLDASRRERQAANADRFPRITGLVDAARYDIMGDSDDYDVRGRIVLNHSLLGRNSSTARVGRAQARVEQAEMALERAINEAERDASIAFRDVEALSRQITTLERTYVANRRTRDLLVEQQRVSRGNLDDMLRAEREFFDAAAALVRGHSELDLAYYVLLSRSGDLLDYFNVSLDFPDSPRGRNTFPQPVQTASSSTSPVLTSAVQASLQHETDQAPSQPAPGSKSQAAVIDILGIQPSANDAGNDTPLASSPQATAGAHGAL